jgi:hypothetical protein
VLFFLVKAKLIDKQETMEANIEKKYQRGRELESYNRFSITSANQHYSSTYLLQILSKFLHSFRPVDLTAGSAAVLSLQPSIISQKEELWI